MTRSDFFERGSISLIAAESDSQPFDQQRTALLAPPFVPWPLVPAMVIAGAPEPTPELAASWSAMVARHQYEPERETTATKPPLPPAPKPSTTSSEKLPPPGPAALLVADAPGSPATVVAQTLATAAAVPSAPTVLAEPQASPAAPPESVADPSAPLPAGHVTAPELPTPASVSSPQAASATTGGPAPLVGPPVGGPAAPVVPPTAPVAQQSRPPSPSRRPSRPHSPAPQQDRQSSRRRRNSPRRPHQQAQWHANHGGRGGWWGPRGRGGGGAYDPPVRMADLQRAVSTAVREERAALTQGSSHAVVARAAPRQAELSVGPPPAAPVPHQSPAPSALAVAASAPVPGSRLRLPPVPPVAGVEFVAAGVGAQYPHPGVGGSAAPSLEEPFQFLAQALQPPQSRVPEATLAQLFRLAESFHALQVLAHSSLPAIPPETFQDRHRESCLDAADQLAVLLAPVLAAPVEGGVVAAGQLDEAVRSLRRHLRAGSGAAAIGASTLVVRELWRSLTGVLHALGAHRM
ncbi:unnamed protein product [Closterium sp. Naga37s-1]|nr:unnamed protein product [Closterium sp. Naga37s-1]